MWRLLDLLFVAVVTALTWFLLAMLFPNRVPQIPVSFAANELQVGFVEVRDHGI